MSIKKGKLEKTNYEKADFLLSVGYAKIYHTYKYTGCIIIDLGYGTWGYIFPCDTTVTIVNGYKIIDYGYIDLNNLYVVSHKCIYDIEKSEA